MKSFCLAVFILFSIFVCFVFANNNKPNQKGAKD